MSQLFQLGDLVYGTNSKEGYMSHTKYWFFGVILSINPNGFDGEDLRVMTLHSKNTHPLPQHIQLFTPLLQEFIQKPTEERGLALYLEINEHGLKYTMDSENLSKVVTISQALNHLSQTNASPIPSNFELFYGFKPHSTFQTATPPTSLP